MYHLRLCHIGVSNGICENASSAFIFASTSSDQINHASSKHFIKDLMTNNEQFVNLPDATEQITHGTDNISISKTYFHSFNSAQIVSISELNLNASS